MNEVILEACRPAPIASYLKGLGVLRLIAEQADPRARGRWRGDVFLLVSSLDKEALIDHFLHRYVPTPLVAPWNGRSGFRDDVNRTSEKTLQALEGTDEVRLQPFREAIAAGRRVYERATKAQWDTKRDKELWVEACRAELPDEALPWLDAVVVLTESDSSFPPLLGGSGGVLGSMDLSNNFMQRILLLFGRDRESDDHLAWLTMSLFDEDTAPLPTGAIGQFDPGQAGESSSTPLGERGKSIVNPWDYVLCLEGALIFASSPARRMGMDGTGRASMPFTVDMTPVGLQTAEDEASGSAEIWAPLWDRPVALPELQRLIGEGRAQWGRHQARTGLDFVRAAASLGVDRGITAFIRHAVVERFGQSKLVVPAGHVEVTPRPEVPPLRELDGWVNRIRWSRERPAAVSAALNRLDAAQYDVALRGGPNRLNDVLEALADLEAAIGVATTFREDRNIRPLHLLPAGSWLPHLDDATPEFRVAVALASLRDHRQGHELTSAERTGSTMATFLRSVQLGPRGYGLEWTGRSPIAPGLGSRHLVEVLLDAHHGRVLTTLASRRERQERAAPGLRFAFDDGRWLRLGEASRFLRGELDDERIGRLLKGLLLLDWRFAPKLPEVEAGEKPFVPPTAWSLLAPFFHGKPVNAFGNHEFTIAPEPSWVWMLGSARVVEVLSRALMRMRMERLEPLITDVEAVARSADGPRLAASLLLPLSPRGVGALTERVAMYELEMEGSTG